jgi:hypothetical protein
MDRGEQGPDPRRPPEDMTTRFLIARPFGLEIVDVPEPVDWFWMDVMEGRVPFLYVQDGEPTLGEFTLDDASLKWAAADDPNDRALLAYACIAADRAR